MTTLLVVIGALIVIVLLVIVWVFSTYNRLVARRNEVRNAWAQIDVQLRRRHDLIPNLINAVRGYMEHERNLLQNITDARTRAIAAGDNVVERSQAEGELTRSLRSLFAVSESYPQLRASENVRSLQEELASTENRVAFARQHYNDAVMVYNTACSQMPGVLIAGPFGFQQADSWVIDEADAAVRDVPQVDLSGATG